MRIWPAVWGALAIVAGTPARAAAERCPSIAVDADAAAVSRWPELAERVRAAFAQRPDIDSCARVHLGLVGGVIDLRVWLPDGRSTSRLARPEDVVAGLEALLLVPEEAAQTEPAPPPADAARPHPVSSTRFEPIVIEVSAKSETRPSRFSVELSLGASMHRGDGQTSAGLGVGSFLEIARWLVGFTARLDRYDGSATSEGGDSPVAAEVGVLLGRRFRFARFMVDAAAGPALALRGNWSVTTAVSGSSGTVDMTRSSSSHNDLVPRGLLTGRLILGARSTVRAFVGVEAELGEPGPIPPGDVRGLPRWSVGAALGVTVGTL